MTMVAQETEEIVFNAIQEYLNENRVIEKHNLINFIKSSFSKSSININEEGIIRNFESLIKKKRIVVGSRLSKDSILNNENRNEIYSYIMQNPGAYFNKIVKCSGLSNHVVYWHLNMLTKFEQIKKAQIENHEIYFDSKLSEKEGMKLYFTYKKESKKILEHLSFKKKGMNKAQLAEELQMHPKTIRKYISYLEEYGFLDKEQISKRETLFSLKRIL